MTVFSMLVIVRSDVRYDSRVFIAAEQDAVVAVILIETSMHTSSTLGGDSVLHSSFPEDADAEYKTQEAAILRRLGLTPADVGLGGPGGSAPAPSPPPAPPRPIQPELGNVTVSADWRHRILARAQDSAEGDSLGSQYAPFRASMPPAAPSVPSSSRGSMHIELTEAPFHVDTVDELTDRDGDDDEERVDGPGRATAVPLSQARPRPSSMASAQLRLASAPSASQHSFPSHGSQQISAPSSSVRLVRPAVAAPPLGRPQQTPSSQRSSLVSSQFQPMGPPAMIPPKPVVSAPIDSLARSTSRPTMPNSSMSVMRPPIAAASARPVPPGLTSPGRPPVRPAAASASPARPPAPPPLPMARSYKERGGRFDEL